MELTKHTHPAAGEILASCGNLSSKPRAGLFAERGMLAGGVEQPASQSQSRRSLGACRRLPRTLCVVHCPKVPHFLGLFTRTPLVTWQPVEW